MNGPPRGRWSAALLQWGALVLVPTSCSEESSTSRTVVSVASAQVSSARLSAARWPQGAIDQIAGGLALDASGQLWAVGAQDRFQPYRYPTWGRVVGIFEWPALRMADGRVHTIEHDAPGMNPNVRASWRPAEWDRDGDAVAFAVARHLPLISDRNIEYVEARGADELYWGCFRRGTKIYRSGEDWGCPRPDERVVRTTVAPELPDEVPGAPDALGTCWRPVEQPIEATRLFPGCLALDRRGTLHDLHITGVPVELAHDVRLATTLEGGRIVVIHVDGTATIRDGNGDRGRGPAPEPLPPGPPVPLELPPVRSLFREGVIHEDGSVAMFWSDEQVLRTLSGFSRPVELAGGPETICVRTEAREVYCRRIPARERRGTGADGLVLEPALFESGREKPGARP